MSTAGQFHFVNGIVKGVDDEYNTRILKAVRDVTVDEIKKVMKEVLLPAFTPGVSNVVVTCAPIMEEVSFPFPSPSSLVFLNVLDVARTLYGRLYPNVPIPRSTVAGNHLAAFIVLIFSFQARIVALSSKQSCNFCHNVQCLQTIPHIPLPFPSPPLPSHCTNTSHLLRTSWLPYPPLLLPRQNTS